MLDHLAYTSPAPKVIAGAKEDWELVIGMEVHAQVASKAKLFSGASTKFGAEPNSNVAFVDAAMPGMLPVINEFCVEQAVRTGLGLKAEINLMSAFDRKNYFYPDLPQGYQISQLYHPIVGEGEIIVDMGPGVARKVRVEMHKRMVLPLACLVLGVFAVPLASAFEGLKRQYGLVLAMGFFLFYYTILSLAFSLGEAGAVSPGTALWLPNLALLAAGAVGIHFTSREKKIRVLDWFRRFRRAA